MMRSMTKVVSCQAANCSFNGDEQCHALAINIGDDEPQCDTFIGTGPKCASFGTGGGVGACKVRTCQFNDCMMCSAPEIRVSWAADARCDTFRPRS